MSINEAPPRRADKSDLRRKLLAHAGKLLHREGPDGISLRKLASEAGTSTMSVYTIFGSKEALCIALFEDGFERLADAHFATPRHPEPILWLWNLACSYRQFALEHRALYGLMITLTLPVLSSIRRESEPTRVITQHRAYTNLIEAVKACIANGSMPEKPGAQVIADTLWATVHGLCSLELAGFYSNREAAEKRFNFCANATMRGMLTAEGIRRLDAAIAELA